MGLNFDVFPGFQQFLAMRNFTLYSVFANISAQCFFHIFHIESVIGDQEDRSRGVTSSSFLVSKILGYEEALWPKKLKISHASQILTHEPQILVLS